ncbi:MAG: fructosamine kinase family protein [Bacteroidales bacterium]|nr:fructosamine kinase family protein [Bacteroidales bacterium]
MIPQAVLSSLQHFFSADLIRIQDFEDLRPVAGGDINASYAFRFKKEDYFIKINQSKKFPNMFLREAEGLHLLNNANCLEVPKVIHTNVSGEFQFLLLQYIKPAARKATFMEDFGHALSNQHKISSDSFGLENDNYIGSLPQSNHFHADWNHFFIEERILPQIRMARNLGRINQSTSSCFDRFFTKIPEIFPVEKPALLHGDLWSGNYMTGSKGGACIFDPAVYFGHREADLAMTKLFGGFEKRFYESYSNNFHIDRQWPSRTDYFNLYPLLVHVNLFGGSYVDSIKRIVNNF